MRGIEGALRVLADVERGMFASESLRHALKDVEPAERKLASTLVYIAFRRMALWKHLLAKFCKRPAGALSRETHSSLVVGIAGVLELRHFKPGVLVNALVQRAKSGEGDSSGEPALINAVLHSVMENAPAYIQKLRVSTALRDQALGFGVPGWVAAAWGREWGVGEAKRLVQLSTMQTWMALRASPGLDIGEWAAGCGFSASQSDISPAAIRVEANPYPPDIPGYGTGQVTPQTESSILAVESLLSHWHGGRLLDMCMGRGIKSGHILTFCKEAVVEGWDLSLPRLRSAEREFKRLGVSDRVNAFCGDALSLEPQTPPSAILLDAPCSGSGTWGRHPDGKWRTNPANVAQMAELQKLLLARACDILSPGGIIIYCTCSIFRDENEAVAGSVLASRTDMVELPAKCRVPSSRRGKPYGTLLFPETPWMDGFYTVILKKKR
ncbi:MAG: RsmB/NOP family class I SAM-dependent RNA methyltransferase [Synergistaceae bacterium]|jgi:16S rRNA (cytosine967-C5)-methyltransferase|nr:RsmB/NOP family class I SAM-dependent RNA methyltransferase [Synergistaceae bacterium]